MDQLSLLIPIEQYAFIKTFSLYILSELKRVSYENMFSLIVNITLVLLNYWQRGQFQSLLSSSEVENKCYWPKCRVDQLIINPYWDAPAFQHWKAISKTKIWNCRELSHTPNIAACFSRRAAVFSREKLQTDAETIMWTNLPRRKKYRTNNQTSKHRQHQQANHADCYIRN